MQATDVQMIADRWMLESRRLINWGSYEGYHEFRPSTDHKLPVTLLAGASESGKSTLVDAQISLLYPTGTPFNKASNSGRSERSDYTYLRGMVGVGSTETGDEPLYLRGRDENGAPQPVWGAIVDTYRNQTTGQVLSCAKFLYLMPGDGRGDVRRQYVVWGKPVDPRRMDQYRDAPFTPAQLKATYPDCLTFPSAEAFHTHIWSAMGLSEAACRLLHKIQSADAPSRLDDIFKQGVLGVPEALDLARTTVEDYERYDENFHAMDEKTRRMDTLRGIQQAYGEYAAARGKARAFEPVKPAVDGTVPAVLRDWALARMRGEVAVQLPADRAEQQNSEAEAKLLRRRTEDLRTRLDMIRGQMQGLDGGNLTRLELELDQARRTLEDVQANRTRIEQTFASIGETLPGDEQAWNERRINAVNFKREYNKRDGECEEALTAAINARAGARGDLERLQRDFDRQRSQRTRISQQMDETRAMLCRATGLTPAELPYVAELMDVNEHEEDWRLAMNVAYAPIAQTILVDKRHEQGFAAKVSTIDPRTMPRRTWQFVDTARHYDDTGAHANILTGEQDGDERTRLGQRHEAPDAERCPDEAGQQDDRPQGDETLAHVPSYAKWLAQQDWTKSYQRHRKNLQLIGLNDPEKRWVLKNPSHLFALDALFATYPDALVIQCHRPAETIMASMCSLAQHTTEGWSNTFVGATIGADSLETWSRGLERFNAVRREHDPAQFYDVDYFQLIRDPIRTVRGAGYRLTSSVPGTAGGLAA